MNGPRPGVLWFCWGTSERTATRWHVVARRAADDRTATALCSISHHGDDLVFQSYIGSSEPICRACVQRSDGACRSAHVDQRGDHLTCQRTGPHEEHEARGYGPGQIERWRGAEEEGA